MVQPVEGSGSAAESADVLAHDARNALNTVSLTMQLVERIVGREAMAEETRGKILDRLGALGDEIEKVRGAVERLRRLSHPEDMNRDAHVTGNG